MLKRSLVRVVAIGWVALAFVVLNPLTANAIIVVNGICTLDVLFTFPTAPTLTGPAVGYNITVSSAGSSCTLDTLDTIPVVAAGSAATGSGGTTLARCGVLAGLGPWSESFSGRITPVHGGTHVIVGTWLEAVMVTSSTPNSPTQFNGVVELLPHPSEPPANLTKLTTCASGGTVTSVRMLGVQVFNDPALDGR